MTKAVSTATVTTGSTHQKSVRSVGLSGPPLVSMATGVAVALSTVVVTRTSFRPGTGAETGQSSDHPQVRRKFPLGSRGRLASLQHTAGPIGTSKT